jgi:hypothetical protein
MKAQYDNQVMSSFFLWFDHALLAKGEAFTNFSSAFHEAGSRFQGYFTYGAPFKQFVSDTSIPGAVVINTLTLNNSTISRGQQSFAAINYDKGHVYFTNSISNASSVLAGNYAVKDFNIFITNDLEEQLLFETQFKLRNKVDASANAIADSAKTYPAVFLKSNGSRNEPFEFGGTDMTHFDVRAMILADSQFNMDAVASLFRDTEKTFVPMVTQSSMPFNSLGDFANPNLPYNYTSLVQNVPNEDSLFIENVFTSKVSGLSFSQKTNVNPDVFSMIIDFELVHIREPRA